MNYVVRVAGEQSIMFAIWSRVWIQCLKTTRNPLDIYFNFQRRNMKEKKSTTRNFNYEKARKWNEWKWKKRITWRNLISLFFYSAFFLNTIFTTNGYNFLSYKPNCKECMFYRKTDKVKGKRWHDNTFKTGFFFWKKKRGSVKRVEKTEE